MATTTNYGWVTPDDTNLVKDGALAIRTLGSSADTTVKNLNPGTTAGDIDYYTSGTAKARIAIGTANQVLQVNSGATAPEWGVDPVADVITTAGDLLYGTAADTVARLGIGTAGQVLKVNSGATAPEWGAASTAFVGCSVYNSAGQSLANETLTALTWDSELYDTDAIHSTATNTSRFTVPSGLGGKWLLNVHIGWVGGGGAGYRGFRPRINGTDNGFVYNYTAGTGIATEYSLVYDLSAADYVEIFGDQSSGGSLSTGGTGATASRVTFTKVG